MSDPPLLDVLGELRSQLQGITLLEGDTSLDYPSVRLKGGLSAFLEALRSAGTSLVFTQQLLLGEDDFTLDFEPDDRDESDEPASLLERPAVQPFRQHLGEPWLLRIFFLHAGYRVEAVWMAPWWDAFTGALQAAQEEHDQVLEAQSVAAQERLREERARMIEVLRERLPTDEAFIALACEARPRITAMRLRAMSISKEVLGFGPISSLEDPILRELAARVRETHRKRR